MILTHNELVALMGSAAKLRRTTMAVYEVRVTGWEAVEADSADEALEKFDQMMRDGYKVSDLRWKTVSTGDKNDQPHSARRQAEGDK